MENDETQKKMDFIIGQQAQFVVDLQILAEAQKRTEAHLSSLAESHIKAEQRLSNLEGALVGMVNLLGDTIKVQKELAEEQKELKATVTELTEKLDVFILTFERYISDRNGKSE